MKKLLTIFCLTVLIAAPMVARGQQNSLDTLTRRFDQYRSNTFQEKVYVHVNQSTFITGETIWFSVYVVNAATLRRDHLSTIAYIDIIDQQNKTVHQGKVQLVDGRGNGSLYLSPAINSGNYILRAYTSWMKNFSPAFFFHKSVRIINTFTPLETKTAPVASPSYDVQFFPEGGRLVAGVKQTIGFRAIDNTDHGIAFIGALVNDKNDTLLHFAPHKFGIGKFEFTAEENATYTAIIKTNDGKSVRVPIGQASSTGYAIHVADEGDQYNVTVSMRFPAGTPPLPVYLFAHTNNQIAHAEFRYITPGETVFAFSKKDLAAGITQITLFNSMLQPVCERLVFRRPETLLNISAKTNQQEYSVRRPVVIDLETSTTGHPLAADVSISVFKKDETRLTETSAIADYLWLGSDLQGTVESPEFYLQAGDDAAVAADNLMLTQGWRRFKWDTILSGKREAFAFLPEFHGHIISGTITSEENRPAQMIMAYLASPSKTPRVYASRSNEQGKIRFETQNFYGPRKVIVQTNYKVDSVHRITIDNPFSDQFASVHVPPFAISSDLSEALTARNLAMQVEDVYYRDRQERFVPAVVDTSGFYGKPDETYLLDDFTRFPVMEEVMREYVPGVLVRKRKDGFHFIVLDNTTHSVFSDTPFMLIDGVPFFDEDEIMKFSPLKIRKLEVVTQRYFHGILNLPGIVSYTTYKGDLAGFEINPHSVVLNYEGLQLQREFYQPKYETQKDHDRRLPDQRFALYWNPSITTTAEGKQQITFYTSDVPGDYSVVIEGIATDGTAGSSSTSFTVKELNN